MALSIENPETERLARELARVTGESITEAVTNALRNRLLREAGHKGDREQIRAEIRSIQARVAALPVLEEAIIDAPRSALSAASLVEAGSDCFSYALARTLGEPLLFTGEDFSQTDVEVAPY